MFLLHIYICIYMDIFIFSSFFSLFCSLFFFPKRASRNDTWCTRIVWHNNNSGRMRHGHANGIWCTNIENVTVYRGRPHQIADFLESARLCLERFTNRAGYCARPGRSFGIFPRFEYARCEQVIEFGGLSFLFIVPRWNRFCRYLYIGCTLVQLIITARW